jgi:AP-3 complex subunit mu
VVLEVLEEMLAAGRPLMSEPSQLRELVVPPAQLLAKVAQNAVNVAG